MGVEVLTSGVLQRFPFLREDFFGAGPLGTLNSEISEAVVITDKPLIPVELGCIPEIPLRSEHWESAIVEQLIRDPTVASGELHGANIPLLLTLLGLSVRIESVRAVFSLFSRLELRAPLDKAVEESVPGLS